MQPPEHRQGPAYDNGASSSVTDGATSSIPPTDHLPAHREATVNMSRAAVACAHAVLVWTPEGRYNRRLFLSLHAADKAMQRARDRGLTASCVMVELMPVPGVPVVVLGGVEK